MTDRSRHGASFAALIATWLAALVVVWPVGEFPLFDDWVYAWSALTLARSGVFEIPEATSALPPVQIAWGAALARVAGASQLVLRISTILAVLLGALAWRRALRLLDFEERSASWAVAVALFSPVFFVLTPTFMTDVPFVAACQAALLAGLAWAQRPGWSRMLVAVALAFIASWVRQPGAALLVGLVVMAAVGRWRDQAIAPFVAILLVGLGQRWYAHVFGQDLPLTQRLADLLATVRVPPGVYVEGVVMAAAFVGLCAAPAVVAAARVKLRPTLIAAGALMVAWMIWDVPVLRDGAMWGPCELGGARTLLSAPPHDCVWGGLARIVAVLLAALGLAVLVPDLASYVRDLPRALRSARHVSSSAGAMDASEGAADRVRIFLGVSFATLAMGMTALWMFADRYWLLPVAAACALVLRDGLRRPRAGAALLAAYALVAVIGTRDVFSFYTSVNSLTDGLMARGVPAGEIDAGYAVNAWRRYLTRPAARAGEGRNTDVPWVNTLTASPWTIANRLEEGWRPVPADRGRSRGVISARGDRDLIVQRLMRAPSRSQRASSGFGTAGCCE